MHTRFDFFAFAHLAQTIRVILAETSSLFQTCCRSFSWRQRQGIAPVAYMALAVAYIPYIKWTFAAK